MKSILIALFCSLSTIVVSQPSWTVITYTNSTTAYGIVTINGNPAESGDWVGAFVGSECRASQPVIINSGTAYANLQIQGEEVETVSFKVWDSSSGKEIDANLTVQSSPGNTIGTPPNFLEINAIDCSLSVSSATLDFTSSAGDKSFTVTSNSTWTVSDDADWISISSAAETGNDDVTVTVTENTGDSRSGTVTVTGCSTTKTITVNQDAAACNLSVSPTTMNFTSSAGSNSFTVTSNSTWTVSDDAAWITISSAAETGNDDVIVSVTENTGNERTGTITISGCGTSKTIVVTQQALCSLSVSPANLDFTSSSEDKSFTVTSNSTWTVSDDADWISISSAAETGNDDVTVTVTENNGDSRSGTVTINGCSSSETITVNQDAPACNLSVSPATLNFTSSAGDKSFTVTSNSTWTVSDDADWISISSAAETGNDDVTVSVTENIGIERTGTITISGCGTSKTIVVTQQKLCSLSVSPANLDFTSSSGDKSFTVTSNSTWTISDDADWISISSAAETGNDNVTVTVTENNGDSRSGTVTINGCSSSETITVNQDAPACNLSVSPATLDFTSSAGDKSFTVTSNSTWTVSDDADWISISSAAETGNDDVTVTVTENTGDSRSGTVTINGCSSSETITVNQDAPACNLSVSPATLDFTASAGDKSFTVTSNSTWTVSDDADWISISSAAETGNDDVIVSVTENTGNERTGTITISGCGTSKTIVVTQQKLCSLSVSPANLDFTSSSGDKSFTVTSNSTWTFSDDADWISISSAAETGNDDVIVSVMENTENERTGTIIISGCGTSKTIVVTQQAACSLKVSVDTLLFKNAGDTLTFTITSNSNWTINHDTTKNIVISSLSGISGIDTIIVKAPKKTTEPPLYDTIIVTDDCGNKHEISIIQNRMTGIDEQNITNARIFPNPFKNELYIEFYSKTEDITRIEVFDIHGSKIKSIRERCTAGLNNVVWDGTDQNGNKVVTGLYFIQLTNNNYRDIFKASFIEQ